MNDPAVTTIDLTSGWAAELARLRAIETAAREVLASGQARYTHLGNDGEWPMLFSVDERHFGDLVPAAAMTMLRAAVEGAQIVDDKPPAASDEYARRLEAALVDGAEEVHGG